MKAPNTPHGYYIDVDDERDYPDEACMGIIKANALDRIQTLQAHHGQIRYGVCSCAIKAMFCFMPCQTNLLIHE